MQLGIRSHHIRVKRQRDSDIAIAGQVDLVEISGSETYLHVAYNGHTLVAQLPGVHNFAMGAACSVYIDPSALYGFDAHGKLLFAPSVR